MSFVYAQGRFLSNSRLIALDERGVSFRWKDYRAKGRTRHKTMTLGADEFMRRFLLHVLPRGFPRIRHYGLLGNRSRATKLAACRLQLGAPMPTPAPAAVVAAPYAIRDDRCPECRTGRLVRQPWAIVRPPPEVVDTS